MANVRTRRRRLPADEVRRRTWGAAGGASRWASIHEFYACRGESFLSPSRVRIASRYLFPSSMRTSISRNFSAIFSSMRLRGRRISNTALNTNQTPAAIAANKTFVTEKMEAIVIPPGPTQALDLAAGPQDLLPGSRQRREYSGRSSMVFRRPSKFSLSSVRGTDRFGTDSGKK